MALIYRVAEITIMCGFCSGLNLELQVRNFSGVHCFRVFGRIGTLPKGRFHKFLNYQYWKLFFVALTENSQKLIKLNVKKSMEVPQV